MRDPARAGPYRDRLERVEMERERLLADESEFDRVDGPQSVARFARRASKPPDWCRFLHALAYRLDPSSVVEMGTGVGMSASAIASALPDARMWTVDLRSASAAHARQVFHTVGVDVRIVTGRFSEVLVPVLIEAAPVDLLFVDGHHEEQATLAYTEQAFPYLSSRAVVVYDDIAWSDGMRRAWKAIQADPRWVQTVDLGDVGVCIN